MACRVGGSTSEARIAAEAELLKAISDDDAEGIRRLLTPEALVAVLLRLRVKHTFNDAGDEAAFFHSVASFGLTSRLGDSIVDLARRSESTEALQVLREIRRAQGVVPAESRIAAEAALLSALVADDDGAIEAGLGGVVPVSLLLQLIVKDTFKDASDDSAFYHSVASYGLRFMLGDTTEQLAERNGKVKAAAALKRLSAPAEARPLRSLHVVVNNIASGDVVSELAADTSWTVARLQGAIPRPALGCYRFVSVSSPLTPGIALADLCVGGDALQLGAILVPVVTGAYHATCVTPGFRRREHRGRISLHLQDDGTLTLELDTTRDGPLPCANRPPALQIVKASFDGAWTSEPPGIVATVGNGEVVTDRRQQFTRPLELGGTLKLLLMQEGQLEVAEYSQIATGYTGLPKSFCSVGTVFLRGTSPQSLAHP